MKKLICFILMLVLCTTSQITAFASENTEKLPSGIAYSDIEAKIDAYVAQHQKTTAAVSVAVFNQDKVLMEKAYGHTDIQNDIVNNSEAVFEWGSCTKLLTWVSVMQLAEKGSIDLNKDIRSYLPKGFFKKLKYDEPVTMLNLMNHNAGWQETITDLFIKNKEDIRDLKDALHIIEPYQVNSPGTTVAYSNWGAALAGYIVECVSGQSFSEYVGKNIFEPLGMEHTSLSSDFSDNQWVAERRMEEKCYTTEGQSLGTCFHYISMYPAGMAIGTLSDFVKFAQAFVPEPGQNSPLFEESNTLDQMLSPSLYYSDKKTARNCHGFWTDEFSVPVLWHNGGTVGSSSWFAFNKESGTGMVILTNQSEESIYNCGLLPLVFGKYSYVKHAAVKADLSGVYVNSRSCFKGYAKLYSLFCITQLSPNGKCSYKISGTKNTLMRISKNSYVIAIDGYKQFMVQTAKNANGRNVLQMPGSDDIQVNGFGVIFKLILLFLFIIAALYSLIMLFIKLVGLARHKGLHPMDGYRIAVNLSVITSLIMFFYIAGMLFMTNSALFKNIQWSLIVCAILAFIPVIYTILLVIKWHKPSFQGKVKAGMTVNCIMGLIMTLNVVYWLV